MKKSTFFAGLLASLLLVGCSKGEEPSSSTKPSTDTSSSQTSSSETSSSQSSSSESSSSESSSSSSTVVTVPAESVTLAGEAEVEVGKTLTLTATVAPETTTDKTVVWTSSDENKATVVNGVVTGVATGTVTIKATCGEKFAEKEIVVKPATVLPTKVTIEQGYSVDVVFKEGVTVQLNASVNEEATNKDIIWESEDPTAATVDENGLVTLLKPSKTKIYAKAAAKESIKKYITITATQVPTKVDISIDGTVVTDTTINETVGNGQHLSRKLTGDFPSYEVTWSTSDDSVVTIDEKGNYKAIAEGTAIITLTSKLDETKKASVTIKVGAAIAPTPLPESVADFTFDTAANNGTSGTPEVTDITVGSYLLDINTETTSKAYTDIEKAGVCGLKVGTNSGAGTLEFTVNSDINQVVIHLASYKSKAKVTINEDIANAKEYKVIAEGVAFETIIVDTSVNKTVKLDTNKGILISKISYSKVAKTAE